MGLSKDEARARLKGLLGELEAVWTGSEGRALSEAMTRHLFIDKYIEVLGYQGMGDLELEHPVRNTGKFIDYVLKVGGLSAIAVEAKALGVSISDEVGAQLAEYQVVEDIEWGIATNARELCVYYLYLQARPQDKCVMKLDLLGQDEAAFNALFERFWLLSKESMSTGPGPRSLIKQSQLERAIQGAILDQGSKVVQALRGDIKERTQGKVKVSGDEVVSWLRNRLARGMAAGTVSDSTAGSARQPPAERRFTAFLKQIIDRGIIPADCQITAQHGDREYAAVIDGDGYILLQGERIRKPGFAARRITGTPTDGFEFWKYQGVSLARLRDKLWQT